ncbi:MAG: Transcription antiterminator NusG [Candidatus Methanohalarchaeum thermophilum]|uniref:Transcription elongation factor Spt5 n=1 Tax=Methanohalarchaeum thermophilum TaxID=1903181 RepID=A0A1Q6DT90_METT1|nr:MAG: Transcription antiterminator NusG [Candidatus Methanohalarchaeum thermophilum]
MVEEKDFEESKIFALKTTANQEEAVADMLYQAAKREGFDIRSVLAPESLKGYILVETPREDIIRQASENIPHSKGIVEGETSLEEVEHFLTPKPSVSGISEGDIVELIAGPFKGEKAKVKRIDETKEEIVLELFEAMVPIPVTVQGDHVRVLDQQEEEIENSS